jgi:phage terminase large subunit-like protein
VIVDELWAHRDEGWYFALRTGSMARERPLLVSITSAGWDTTSICYELYERGLQGDPALYFHWLSVPDDKLEDPRAVKAANPASWLTVEDLLRERAAVRASEFERLHMNRWTTSEDVWIAPELWAGCRSSEEIPEGSTVYVGVDASFSGDATACAWAWRNEDGCVVLRCRVWSALPATAAHVHLAGGRIDLAAVEDFVTELAQRYTVREVVYDPSFFARSAELLSARGLTVASLDQRSAAMRAAYSQLYEAIGSRMVAHNGDPVLTAHVLSAAAQPDEYGSWKVRKLKQSAKIDGLVACVIAHSRAIFAQPVPEPFYAWA